MTTSLSNITVKDGQNTLVVKANDITINGSSILTTNNFVTLDTDQSISGAKTFNVNYTNFQGKDIDIINAKTTQAAVGIQWLDKNGTYLGQNHIRTYTTGAVQNNMYIKAHNSNNWGCISIGFDANDNLFTYAPTPSVSDNSSMIATTAFVKNQGYAIDSYVVKTSGNQTIAGEKTFNGRIRFTNQVPTIRNVNDDWSTAPTEQIYYQWACEDKNGIWLGGFEANHLTNGDYSKGMYVRQQNGNAWASIIVGITSSGTPYTFAPTPAVSSNDANIATTAYCNSKHQVVSALPASPDANVFYYIPA